MIVYLANKTQFRADLHEKGAQASYLFLRDGQATGAKATGRMPMLLSENSSAPSALLGVLPARHSPQDGGGCALDPARRQSPFRGTSRSLLSMSFHSIAVQNSFLSHNRCIPIGLDGYLAWIDRVLQVRETANTDAKHLAVEMAKRHDAQHMSIVCSTYHSLDVISRAQQPQLRAIRISKLNRTVSHIS